MASKRYAKQKGSTAERDLLDMLWTAGFAVLRTAGSGSTSHDACDLIAGKSGTAYAIEVKVCQGKKQYVDAAQVKELLNFSTAFGATPILAVKFLRRGWHVLDGRKLEQTGKHYGASLEQMQPLDDWLKTQLMGFEVHE